MNFSDSEGEQSDTAALLGISAAGSTLVAALRHQHCCLLPSSESYLQAEIHPQLVVSKAKATTRLLSMGKVTTVGASHMRVIDREEGAGRRGTEPGTRRPLRAIRATELTDARLNGHFLFLFLCNLRQYTYEYSPLLLLLLIPIELIQQQNLIRFFC